MHRLRAIKAKAREHEEERGLRTLFAAIGMVSWPATDGGRDPLAPLFLVPVSMVDDPRVRGDLAVRRNEDAEIVPNRALLTLAPPAVGEALRDLFQESAVDEIPAAFASVRKAIGKTPNVVVHDRCALGIFNFAYMAMIDDLHEAGDALANHPIIRALAGDVAAQEMLLRLREGAVEVEHLDEIPPIAEPFVLDADPWQARSIHTLLQHPDSHATIDGPPGTGKSQTIANLIAALIAQGKRVLFVAEKKAALDVVRRRLERVGLGNLVLDLHGADVTRRRVYSQLKSTANAMRDATPAPDGLDGRLEAARARLNGHSAFMHSPLGGCGLSPYQILGGLAGLPKVELRTHLLSADLAALPLPALEKAKADLREAARAADVFLRRGEAPWSHSTISSETVGASLERIASAPSNLAALQAALRRIAVAPASRAEFSAAIAQLQIARRCLALFAPDTLSLDAATLELVESAWRSALSSFLAGLVPSKRRAVAVVHSHILNKTASRLRRHEAIATLRRLTEPWRGGAATVAALDPEIDTLAETVDELLNWIETLIGRPLPKDLDAALELISQHAADRNGLGGQFKLYQPRALQNVPARA
jgi:hypothetical protein